MTNDSAIKLFGRTIFQTHNTNVTTNDYSLEFSPPLAHEDFSDHSLHSSLSSSSTLEVNSSNEHDSKRYKVCFMRIFHSFCFKINNFLLDVCKYVIKLTFTAILWLF